MVIMGRAICRDEHYERAKEDPSDQPCRSASRTRPSQSASLIIQGKTSADVFRNVYGSALVEV